MDDLDYIPDWIHTDIMNAKRQGELVSSLPISEIFERDLSLFQNFLKGVKFCRLLKREEGLWMAERLMYHIQRRLHKELDRQKRYLVLVAIG